MRLRVKIALITGGNSGIGLCHGCGCSWPRARASPSSAATRRRSTPRRRSLATASLRYRPTSTDVEETERCREATAAERLGKLDVVFANAGVGGTSPLGQTSLAAFEQHHPHQPDRVVLHRAGRAAAPPRRRVDHPQRIGARGHGRAGLVAYAAAKGGVRSMTRNLAVRARAARDPRQPGDTRVGRARRSGRRYAPTDDAMAALEARLSRSAPLGRMGEADEVAAPCCTWRPTTRRT